MYGFGHLWELVVVLLIALVFLGPKRLPELGSSLGQTIREFRKSTSKVQDQLTGEPTAALPAAEQDDAPRQRTAPPRARLHQSRRTRRPRARSNALLPLASPCGRRGRLVPQSRIGVRARTDATSRTVSA